VTWWTRFWTALVDRLKTWTDLPVSSAVSGWWGGSAGAVGYAALYRSQPHVRTVVDFLASQLGQLGIQVFRRLSDTDRVRVHAHPLSQLLRAPNPGTARYAWISEMVQDWAVFGMAFAIKLRRPGRLELYRIPATAMRPFGDLIPRGFTWTMPDGRTLTLPASEVFYLRQYNPDDSVSGLSPLETLRKLLAAEEAAVTYREWFWQNGAKLAGWIKRPKEAPRWTEQQRKQLLVEFSDSEDVYVQFNINEKLQGSFEEEQAALATATGSPYMTRNEARARLNLPRINDAAFDVPVTRLDIAEGQNARDAATAKPPMSAAAPIVVIVEPTPAPPAPPPPDLAPLGDRIVRAVRALPGELVHALPVPPSPPEPVDLTPLGDRLERALQALPDQLAERLPAPAPPTVVTRTVRDEAGRIVALEDRAVGGAVLRRRVVIRGADGRPLEVEVVDVGAEG
jgi:phage portal protein BeeE